MSGEGELVQSAVRSRGFVLLSAVGLVGVGAALGAGSVYLFYIRDKLSNLSSQLKVLKKEVEKVKQKLCQENGNAGSSRSDFPNSEGEMTAQRSSMRNTTVQRKGVAGSSRRTVRFKDGYETGDDDEYITASSDSDIEIQIVAAERREPIESTDVNLDIPASEGPDIAKFLKNIDELLDGNASSQQMAFTRLQSSQEKMSHLCGFWWRFAKATHMKAGSVGASGDKEERKNLTFEGCRRAERALELNDASPNAHKWFAITLGSKGDFVSINERIKNGYKFKEHVDKAVELNPKDPSLHHLLGRFCFEVCQLGWVERKAASALFSSPPNSTPEEALEHFKKAEDLGTTLKENKLFIAKCYIALKDYKNAAEWLQRTLDMPNVSSGDAAVHDEAENLFASYERYLD